MRATVYPRVCGGTLAILASDRLLGGLSPRVRGNRRHVWHTGELRRSIPACAGEPGHSAAGWRIPGVYPRVCGGTPSMRRRSPCRQGLSPRVRGNHGGGILRRAAAGSIPACAGEPAACPRGNGWCGVYPRVCGGTAASRAGTGPPSGLSPRVRGDRLPRRPNHGGPGSIPACAGEPAVAAREQAFDEVYPRVCGGTTVWRVGPPRGWGLSPRVRGNPAAASRASGRSRSIPACAGEPRT